VAPDEFASISRGRGLRISLQGWQVNQFEQSLQIAGVSASRCAK